LRLLRLLLQFGRVELARLERVGSLHAHLLLLLLLLLLF
jgi:hypothetical protein